MIRNAKRQDLEAILDIYNEAILNTTAVYTYEAQTLQERESWFETKILANEPIFVYERDKKVVGFATYGQFRNWPAYLYSIEHSIYVDKCYRGKGIASQLLSHLIKDAKQRNYRTIIAGIDASNEGSIKLHEKFGFTHSGTIKNVGYKFERWLDLAFYQYDLFDK
ncbi:GNAT family N-acetyltransferase [Staphylococcus sp. NRL 16/872]|uniref:GNAT family N-acetyltransferase n=1 Tax=Staphylococcus sp. NRL 16/872 TaxID=2930131 RepID=UPI001FB4A0D9|nr:MULTISPECIES: GNAT family N-acetyltransferase [unclassified Staphylococcus]MCJ1655567.1 N-acetyltransferase family protein [Staphylococcus sp. NRL 21/187]MCJ1661396.1 N-acetyltransferase family protein [Staphylococcus sp. NRL 18/288]MCJ1667291.1 N-acetyltransferase family protein [Staphylococcus sp. NRL 19/737]WEN70549.1 GNAT family N-acetyltransferase [Staphylococcus sp. NRL 16/872]